MIKCLKFLLFLGLFSFIASTTLVLAQEKKDQQQVVPFPRGPRAVVPYGKETPKEPSTFGKKTMSVKYKPINCGPKESLFKDLKESWGELPVILVIEPVMANQTMLDRQVTMIPLKTIFFFNVEKGTYTVVQTPPIQDFENQVCILSSGAIHHFNKKLFNKLMGVITINF